ncbi:hypothetical protein GB931_03385 [Modestobacter sp. I12A-02628]|uniref:DUF5709 domain-containing protein n=1 Tax=Goekera deserti TaxID=2497753 RepID=A0A7K3WD09_9ACTN|nr:hypothetical protein [Goekera deserti]MPQ96980.1 hypothetical protein [Goekera deserti]NDI46705.1 hypothetical protein [Goekera deserti]NEL54274.1 hypothetical protein [Goekera deserti]
MTQPEGQTARDISFEDNGIPDLQDGSPEQQWNEDPEFLPEPGERPTATVDFGTTAAEQATGEDLTGRLDREVPDVTDEIGSEVDAGARPAEDPRRTSVQLHQDDDRIPGTSSGTDSTTDDVLAVGDEPVGGQGPEESAVHVIDG